MKSVVNRYNRSISLEIQLNFKIEIVGIYMVIYIIVDNNILGLLIDNGE